MKKNNNKFFNKIFTFTFVLLFLLFTVIFPIQNMKADQCLLSFQSNAQKYPTNSEFILSIKINNVTDLFGYTTDIQFNKNLVEYISLEEGDIFRNNGKESIFQFGVNLNDGSIKVASAIIVKQSGINGNGSLFNIKFKSKYPGKASFKLNKTTIKDSNLVDIPFSSTEYLIDFYDVDITPILSVEPNLLDFGKVNFGESPKLKFIIKNIGKGDISGDINSLNPWIKVDPYRFDGDTEVSVTLISNLIAPNIEYSGEIKIKSNAGEASVNVKVTTIKNTPTEPPYIKILTPDDNLITNESKVFILCETKPGCFASFNSQNVSVDLDDGVFFYNSSLKEGKNVFEISVWDAYMNKKTELLTINRDTTPPELIVDNIPLLTNKIELTISGKVSLDTKSLKFNGGTINFDKDGKFSVSYNAMGDVNQLFFTALDELDNKISAMRVFFYKPVLLNSISLIVGNKIGYFNGRKFDIEAPPIIKEGRVLVPLRVISDIFGADLEWISESKEIVITLRSDKIILKVGDFTANINGKRIRIDSPPFISNGRTMVPIRFISESFKSEVDWNPDTKTVLISF
jgi:hypothetical protein